MVTLYHDSVTRSLHPAAPFLCRYTSQQCSECRPDTLGSRCNNPAWLARAFPPLPVARRLPAVSRRSVRFAALLRNKRPVFLALIVKEKIGDIPIMSMLLGISTDNLDVTGDFRVVGRRCRTWCNGNKARPLVAFGLADQRQPLLSSATQRVGGREAALRPLLPVAAAAPSVRFRRGGTSRLRAATTPPDSVTLPSRLLSNPSTRAGGARWQSWPISPPAAASRTASSSVPPTATCRR